VGFGILQNKFWRREIFSWYDRKRIKTKKEQTHFKLFLLPFQKEHGPLSPLSFSLSSTISNYLFYQTKKKKLSSTHTNSHSKEPTPSIYTNPQKNPSINNKPLNKNKPTENPSINNKPLNKNKPT